MKLTDARIVDFCANFCSANDLDSRIESRLAHALRNGLLRDAHPVSSDAAAPSELRRIGYATLYHETIIGVHLEEPTPTDFIKGYSGKDMFILAAPSPTIASDAGAQPDERAATWQDAFNERHRFDVYPDDFMTGLRNEFCAGWQARATAPQATVKCQTCNDHGVIGGPSYREPDEGGVPCPDCSSAQQADATLKEAAILSLTEELREVKLDANRWRTEMNLRNDPTVAIMFGGTHSRCAIYRGSYLFARGDSYEAAIDAAVSRDQEKGS